MSPDKIQIIDLETENKPFFGAVASPRHPDNYVVALGQAIDGPGSTGAVQGFYYTERPSKWLHIPNDVWLLVAHNAAFELDWMLHQERDEIMKFIARGGRIFDTAYAEYLLSNQQETYPSLDETAPKYGGTHKVDGVKLLWEQGYLTSQIDKDLLMEYLAGPEGDIENTRKTFYGQYAKLADRGMLPMFWDRMDGLIYNAMAMDAGLYVDKTVAFQQLEEQNRKLDELRTLFNANRNVPGYVEFKESSDYHMSAWLFGGPIRYRIKDVWYEEDGVTPKYEKVECYKFGDAFVIAEGMSPESFEGCVQSYGPPERYKSGKNKGQIKLHKINGTEPKKKYYDRLYQCEPLVDLDLLPKDLREEFEHEFVGKRKLADESPVYSTGADCIEMLSKRPEFPENVRHILGELLKFAKIDKDVGTYYMREDKDEEGNVVKQSGMLQYLTPHSIVYHVLNTTSTVTTRLSSNRPNMQNIPRGDTSQVKAMFRSRYDSPVWLAWALSVGIITKKLHDECLDGIQRGEQQGAIIEADYSALEVVTLAAFSKDKALIKALLEGIDMHCMRLAASLGEPYEDVLLKCKDENHPSHKAYKTMRTNIKPKAFAYQYGATARGIAFATGCTVQEAQDFIDAEKALFPEVEAYYENVVFAEVESTATVHRATNDDGSWVMYRRGTFTAPGKTRYEFREYPKKKWVNGQKFDLMEFKPTQMRNYPIQGESGYFVQGIAGQVMRWLVSRNFFDGKVFIINQVHDALYFDCHVSVLQEVAAAIKQIMEYLPQYFNQRGYDLTVPFPAEVEAGPSMLDKHKVTLH